MFFGLHVEKTSPPTAYWLRELHRVTVFSKAQKSQASFSSGWFPVGMFADAEKYVCLASPPHGRTCSGDPPWLALLQPVTPIMAMHCLRRTRGTGYPHSFPNSWSTDEGVRCHHPPPALRSRPTAIWPQRLRHKPASRVRPRPQRCRCLTTGPPALTVALDGGSNGKGQLQAG